MTRRFFIPSRARAGLLACAVVSAALVLSACAPSGKGNDDAAAIPEGGGGGLMDYSATMKEYRDAAAEFALPDGFVYPEQPLLGEDESYQTGYGRSRAVYEWNCAWGTEWLRLRGVDADAAGLALEQYAAAQQTDVFQKYWDPVSMQEPFVASVEAAQLGDASLIQSDVGVNCR